MNHEAIRKDLDAYIDGRLPESRRAKCDEHLERCRECRDEVMELRTLTARARSLAREIDPPRDLWPGIEAGLRGRRRAAPTRPEAWGWGGRWKPSFLRGGVAALGLLALLWAGALLAPPRMHRDGTRPASPSAEGPGRESTGGRPGSLVPEIAVITDDLRPRSAVWARMIWALEEENLGASKVLGAVLAGGRDPEAIARSSSIEPGLRTLDLAILETAAALRGDPENQELARSLVQYYERKLELYRLAVRIAGGTLT